MAVCACLAFAARAEDTPPTNLSQAERAGALLASGLSKDAAAAAEPCAASDARCALVLARALLGSQRAAEAASALGAKVDQLGDLEPHGQALLGEALLLAGQAESALVPLRRAAALDVRGPAGVRAACLLADALLAAGHPEEAAAAVASARTLAGLSASEKAGLAFTRMAALGKLASAADAPDQALLEAAQAARELWLTFPAHPGADQARLDEEVLAKRLEGGFAAPTGRQLLSRASRLLSAGQPAAAVEASREAVAALARADSGEGNLLLARTLAAAGKRADATVPLQIAWARGGRRFAPPAGLLLARDRARRGQWSEAVKLLDELARRYAKASEAPEAQLLAARLLEEHGQAAVAKARLERLALGRGPRPADARWGLAWAAYRAGDENASARFLTYARQASDPVEKARGLYWAARSGEDEDAAALFAQAEALDPLGYYGALALAAAGKASPEQPAFPPGPPTQAGAAETDSSQPRLAVGRELVELGLCAEATAELDMHLAQHRGTAAALVVLPLFESCHRFDRALTLAQVLLGSASAADRPALLRSAYPSAYPELVERSARRTRLDPYLLLSVARRESLFRPDVQSAAGAVGLVQLLPKTAARICAVLGRPAPEQAELADPGTALDLGAWYFSELLGVFGDPAIAAAAYNAGPHSARKWVESSEGRRLDEWVEEIPYRETRLYVRNVIGAWSAYRILAGGKAPALSEQVPAPKGGVAF